MYHPLHKSAAYAAQYVRVRFQFNTSEKIISGTGFFAMLDRLYFVTNRHNLDAEYYNKKYKEFRPVEVSIHSYNNDYKRQLASLLMDSVEMYVSMNDAEDVALIDCKNLKVQGFLQPIQI